ncbi:MAG: hypothetical protein WDN04_23350 [Rhodospirillales bacterium]
MDLISEPDARYAALVPPPPPPSGNRLQAAQFVLLSLCALYVARGIVIPVVFAVVLKLALQPLVRWLQRTGLPRSMCATIALAGTLAAIIGVVSAIGTPRRLLGRPAARCHEPPSAAPEPDHGAGPRQCSTS